MSMFWIAAAIMLVLAMAFLLLPMLRATHADADASRRDALLQARRSGVLDEAEYRAKLAALPAATRIAPPRLAIALVVVLLPLCAVLGYRNLGEPRALDPALSAAANAMNAALAAQGDAPATAPDMEAAVAGLAERMRQTPDDLDGWMLLGRAYKSTERFEPARDALANAYRIAPDDPDVMIEYAEALVLASPSHRFEGEPLRLLTRALERQPDSQRGLLLLGVSAFQSNEFATAAATWERLLASMPADASARPALLARIADARARAGLPAQAPAADTPAPPAAATAAAAPGAARLTVSVDITAELGTKIADGDVLFVFARAATGPRIPLAIQRLPATALPVTVTLDDSTSMMLSMTLSSTPQVVIGARISKSGEAIAQSGDFETLSEPLPNTRAEPVLLTIDRIVP